MESEAPTSDRRAAAPRRVSALVGLWLGWWIICFALWLVLDDTTVAPEMVDGAVAAVVGATAATLTVARSPVRFAPRGAWLRRLDRPLLSYFTDLPVLVRVLARALTGGERDPGRLRAVSFRLEREPGRRTAQVALASVAGSFAPNCVVVAVEEDAGELIVHELSPRSGRAGADPLALG